MAVKAFPTAYGAGYNTTGGRGGTVVHVTNLNDNGIGSFREAVSSPNRIVIFDVSGVISLNSSLAFSNNLTIAGQTAPEGGITIDGNVIYMESSDNIIVRYIRFRGGVDYYIDFDSATIRDNATNHIWDHCSFSFGTDEAASWYGTGAGDEMDNITIQRCFFAESSKGSIIGTASGVGAIAGDFSFIENLYYNCSYRFPNIASDGGNLDVVNNVAWNVNNRLIRGNGSFNLNHIGNYYDYGTTPIEDRFLNLFSYGTIPQIYTFNNKIVAPNTTTPLTSSVSQMNSDNKLSWKFFQDGGGYIYGEQLPSNYFTETQFALRGEAFTPQTPDAAFEDIKTNVGCNARLNADGSVSNNIDVLDSGWLTNVNNGTYVPKSSSSTWNVPAITSISRPVGFYSTNAHIPETWFAANVPINEDETDLAPSGYPWMEEYINQVDSVNQIGDIPVIILIGPSTINIENGDTYIELGATASDTEDGVIFPVIITGWDENTSVDGTYYKYYNIQDSDGNNAIQVVRIINVTTSGNIEYPLTDIEISNSKISKVFLTKINN